MNLVEPPAIPKGKLALMNAKIRFTRMMDQVDDSDRAQIVASAVAMTLGWLAMRLKVPQLIAIAAAASAGFMLGTMARGKTVKA